MEEKEKENLNENIFYKEKEISIKYIIRAVHLGKNE